jgi:hypothetical protein
LDRRLLGRDDAAVVELVPLIDIDIDVVVDHLFHGWDRVQHPVPGSPVPAAD